MCVCVSVGVNSRFGDGPPRLVRTQVVRGGTSFVEHHGRTTPPTRSFRTTTVVQGPSLPSSPGRDPLGWGSVLGFFKDDSSTVLIPQGFG